VDLEGGKHAMRTWRRRLGARLRGSGAAAGPEPAALQPATAPQPAAPQQPPTAPEPAAPQQSPTAPQPAAAEAPDEGSLSAEQEAAYDASAAPAAFAEGDAEAMAGVPEPPEPLAAGGGDGSPAGARRASLSARIHNLLPMAIVAVSVLAAVMGWRASLAEESATHSDELARQDVVSQQEGLLQALQGVDSDVRLFGLYEWYSVLGHALLRDAGAVGGSEGQALARQGQGDIEIARGIGGEFSYDSDYTPSDPSNYYSSSNTTGSLESDGTYKPGNPYRFAAELLGALSGNSQLTSLEPDLHRSQAKTERDKAVDLVGVAALFIAALVFFTLSAVSREQRTVSLAAVGLVVAIAAIVLFPIVELG